MIKEAIILAGGFGTRLKDITKDKPKPMVEIKGQPFLAYLFDFLIKQKIRTAILSVFYKFEVIKAYFGEQYKDLSIIYAVEKEPLGTGGAIKNSLNYVKSDEVFVLNGDTFFDIEMKNFYKMHKSKNSKFSIALKRIEEDESRYGFVIIDKSNKIIGYQEKIVKQREEKAIEDRKNVEKGINGGFYIINKGFFLSLAEEEKFSLEKDFLEKYYKNHCFYGFLFDKYFIDIGVPETYERAKRDFENFKY